MIDPLFRALQSESQLLKWNVDPLEDAILANGSVIGYSGQRYISVETTEPIPGNATYFKINFRCYKGQMFTSDNGLFGIGVRSSTTSDKIMYSCRENLFYMWEKGEVNEVTNMRKSSDYQMEKDTDIMSLVIQRLKVGDHNVNLVKLLKNHKSSDGYDEYMIEGDGLYPFIKFDPTNDDARTTILITGMERDFYGEFNFTFRIGSKYEYI